MPVPASHGCSGRVAECGVAEFGPCPLGRESLVMRYDGSAVQAGGLSVRVISRGGRGRGREQPALPRSAGRSCCPGDMMIDWVSPACGDAAAQSNQAVRLAR